MVADVQLRHVVDAGQRQHHHREADEQVHCKWPSNGVSIDEHSGNDDSNNNSNNDNDNTNNNNNINNAILIIIIIKVIVKIIIIIILK